MGLFYLPLIKKGPERTEGPQLLTADASVSSTPASVPRSNVVGTWFAVVHARVCLLL